MCTYVNCLLFRKKTSPTPRGGRQAGYQSQHFKQQDKNQAFRGGRGNLSFWKSDTYCSHIAENPRENLPATLGTGCVMQTLLPLSANQPSYRINKRWERLQGKPKFHISNGNESYLGLRCLTSFALAPQKRQIPTQNLWLCLHTIF